MSSHVTAINIPKIEIVVPTVWSGSRPIWKRATRRIAFVAERAPKLDQRTWSSVDLIEIAF
jgi:hypothetical protein